jgi:voltage-gated potassium channel
VAARDSVAGVAEGSSPSQASGSGRGAAIRASLLTLLYAVAAIAAYFALPPTDLDRTNVWGALLMAALAIAILVVLYLASLRTIGRAEFPVLRALLVIAVFFVTFVLLVAYAYLSLETRFPGQVPGIVTHVDALYFTVTVITTVGFGDISPQGQLARGIATAQMVFTLVFLGALLRSAVNVGRSERQRRHDAQADPDGG